MNASQVKNEGDISGDVANPLRVSVLIMQIVSPVNVVLGLFGNILLAAALIRNWKKHPYYVYMIWLCFADSFALIGILFIVVPTFFNVSRINWDMLMTDAGCNIMFLLIQSPVYISSWVLVLLTFERLVVTWFPIKSRTMVSQKRALVYTSIMTSCILAIFFITFGGLKQATHGMT